MKEGVITEDNAVERTNRIRCILLFTLKDKGEIEGLRLDVGLFARISVQVVRAFGYDSVPMRGVDFEAIKIYLKVPNDWEPPDVPVERASRRLSHVEKVC